MEACRRNGIIPSGPRLLHSHREGSYLQEAEQPLARLCESSHGLLDLFHRKVIEPSSEPLAYEPRPHGTVREERKLGERSSTNAFVAVAANRPVPAVQNSGRNALVPIAECAAASSSDEGDIEEPLLLETISASRSRRVRSQSYHRSRGQATVSAAEHGLPLATGYRESFAGTEAKASTNRLILVGT